MVIEKLLTYKAFTPYKDKITEHSKKQLVLVYKMCEDRNWDFHSFKPILSKMVEYDVNGSWQERMIRSKEEFKHDSSSLASFQNRYGEEKGKEL